jgi:HD-GYP domain-containing protein (c-di-GMP phosphodiesterase class II)
MPGSDRQSAALAALPAEAGAPTLAEIISAFSFALDLTEGAVPGHALRCCLLGMRLGWELGFSDAMLGDLYHALLLKDVGCSSNAARMCQIIGGGDDRAVKSGVKLEDWTKPHKPSMAALRLLWSNVLPDSSPMRKVGRIVRIALAQHRNNEEMIQLRCDRGASIVRKIGLSEQTAQAVRSLDEHWNGSGYPDRLKRAEISPLSRVMAVAQHLDVFALERGSAQAMLVLRERSGHWFDPQIVRAAESLHRRNALWMQCLPGGEETTAQRELSARAAVLDLAPAQAAGFRASHIDLICEAFAEVVDAKSHFTFRHSVGVTDVASAIGTAMGLNPERKQLLHRAALLHDLGKLRVPNSILDKPGKLDGDEWSVMREHPMLTRAILGRVKQFRELSYIAGTHHEKLDGSGYPDGLSGEELSLEARILAVSDVYGALVEDRPYRRGFEPEQALAMLARDVPAKLDADCLQALGLIAPSLPRAAAEPQTCALPDANSVAAAGVEPRPYLVRRVD